jgi:hypothetical protein
MGLILSPVTPLLPCTCIWKESLKEVTKLKWGH